MRLLLGLALAVALSWAPPAFGSWAGTRDPSFGTRGITTLDVVPGASTFGSDVVVQQPGGRILVGGYAVASDGSTQAVVAGLRDDGALDASFGTGGVARLDGVAAMATSDLHVELLALADGRVLVLGATLVRLDADGRRDAGFGGGAGAAQLPAGFVPGGASLAPDGRIVVVGGHPEGDAIAGAVVRLTADGLPDSTFGDHGMAVLPSGGTVSGDQPAATPGLTGAAVLDDESLYVAGPAQRNAFSGFAPVVIARLGSDGALDQGFGDGGRIVLSGILGLNGSSLHPGPDGGAVLGGFRGIYHGGSAPWLQAIPSDGKVTEDTFGSYADTGDAALIALPGGWLWSATYGDELQLNRFGDGPELGVDESGRDDFLRGESITRLPDGVSTVGRAALQSDGKVLVVGTRALRGGGTRLLVVRLLGFAPRITQMLVTQPRASMTRFSATVPAFCPLRRCRGVAQLRAGGRRLARGPFDMTAGGPMPIVLSWSRHGRDHLPATARVALTLEGGSPSSATVRLVRASTAPPPGRRFGALRPLVGAVAAFATDGRRWLAFTQPGSVQILDTRTQRRYAVPNPAPCTDPKLDVSFPMVLMTCVTSSSTDGDPWLVDVQTGRARHFRRSSPALGRYWMGPVPRPCKVSIANTHCDRYLAWRTGRTRTFRVSDLPLQGQATHDLDSPQLAPVRGCPPVESPSRTGGVLVDGLYAWPYVLLLATADPHTNPRPGLFVAQCTGPGRDAHRRELADDQDAVGPQLGSGLVTWSTKGTTDVFAYAVRSGRRMRWAASDGDDSMRDPARVAPTADAVIVAAATHENCEQTFDCATDAWTLSQALRRR